MKSIILSCIFSLLATNAWCVEENSTRFSLLSESAVLPQELDLQRGQGGIDMTTLNLNSIQATMSDTSANNNTTGFNVIDNGAFTNAGGLISVIQNTGNNVIIQDSTIVNVTIIP